jgi:tRNA G18 (ribose-2'-O)-methylase SpoU
MPQVFRVSDLADERLRDYRNVPDRELLRARGLFVAEGRLVVERLIASSTFDIESVLVTDTAYAALAPALERLPEKVAVLRTEAQVLRAVTGFNIHRGCLALGVRPEADVLARRAWRAIGEGRLVIVLERLADADNVGSIVRAADAFGASAVVLDPHTCDPLYRKAIRVSMGAVFHLPFAIVSPLQRTCDQLRDAGYRLLALTPQATRVIDAEPRTREASARIALIVGAEGGGLSASALEAADEHVRIAMAPGVDSINVATAAAIALHWFGSREET